MKAVKQLLNYIQGSKNYCITLGMKPDEKLRVSVDAAHHDCEDGKSTEAFICTYAGAPISWHSKKQSIMAPANTIAEYCAIDPAVKEALYIKKLIKALDMEESDEIPKPIPIYTDSNNAITVMNKKASTPVTKWIDNRYFFVRDILKNGQIEVIHINGTDKPADGLTKALEAPKFKELVKMSSIDTSGAMENSGFQDNGEY
jgi:hypothetical protein